MVNVLKIAVNHGPDLFHEVFSADDLKKMLSKDFQANWKSVGLEKSRLL